MSNQFNDKIVDDYKDRHPRTKLTAQELFNFLGYKDEQEYEPTYKNELEN